MSSRRRPGPIRARGSHHRHCEEPATRLRSNFALERRSNPESSLAERLDCGACHRARIRATRWLALAMTEGSILPALEPADMLLGVEFEPDPADQVDLGFEEVDVVFLVLHQLLEQVARDVILHGVTMGCGFLIKRPRADLGGEIAIDDFLDILADPKRIEHLHVRKAVE